MFVPSYKLQTNQPPTNQRRYTTVDFPANQGFLKTFQIALIGWLKAGPPKKPL